MVNRSSFSRNWLSSRGTGAIADLGRRSVRSDSANNRAQNRIGCLAIGVGVEVQNNTVAKDRERDSLDVFDAQVIAAVHQSAYAAALHQRLRAARRTTVPDIFLCQFVRFGL